VTVAFYLAGAVALIATLLVVTRHDTIHALLYLIVSLFAVAVVFYTLGAPFVAALEVIVYAGAIIVLFLFTVMLLNIGHEAEGDERRRLRPVSWLGPGLLPACCWSDSAWPSPAARRPRPAPGWSDRARSAWRSTGHMRSASSSPRRCCWPP